MLNCELWNRQFVWQIRLSHIVPDPKVVYKSDYANHAQMNYDKSYEKQYGFFLSGF